MPILDTIVPSGSGEDGGVCTPWATSADVTGPCADYSFDTDYLDIGLQIASDVLFELTGRRFPGVCVDTIRPPSECECSHDHCGCGYVSEYRLPGFPVVSVEEILVDGAVIPQARYRVDNYALLVYQPDPAATSDPIAAWPRRQRLGYPTTEDGTWQITYMFGAMPPAGGVRAAAHYGCQLAMGMAGSSECALDPNVRSIVRQNLTIAVADPSTLVEDGLTGLSDVDAWVASILLGEQRKPASVWVPGRKRAARRQTWP